MEQIFTTNHYKYTVIVILKYNLKLTLCKQIKFNIHKSMFVKKNINTWFFIKHFIFFYHRPKRLWLPWESFPLVFQYYRNRAWSCQTNWVPLRLVYLCRCFSSAFWLLSAFLRVRHRSNRQTPPPQTWTAVWVTRTALSGRKNNFKNIIGIFFTIE